MRSEVWWIRVCAPCPQRRSHASLWLVNWVRQQGTGAAVRLLSAYYITNSPSTAQLFRFLLLSPSWRRCVALSFFNPADRHARRVNELFGKSNFKKLVFQWTGAGMWNTKRWLEVSATSLLWPRTTIVQPRASIHFFVKAGGYGDPDHSHGTVTRDLLICLCY